MSDALLTRLLSMSRAIAGEMDRQSVLNKVGAELRHLIPHDHLDLSLLVDDGKMNITYEVGIHTSWTDPELSPHPVVNAPIRAVLWGEVPFLLTGDAPVDPRFHFHGALDGPIFAARLRSRLHVPLRVQGKVIGSLNVSRHEPHEYDGDHVRVAQDVADLLAPYLRAITRAEQASKAAVAESEARAREEMLRIGALRLTEGMERERQRLGMDLHDQTLADLSRLSRRISDLVPQERISGDDLQPIEEELALCLQELRGIIEDTRPGILQLFGFVDAIEALLLRSTEGAEPAIEVSIDDRTDATPDRLTDAVRTSLYRIVQEAVNNAVKHGRPEHIGVQVDTLDGRLVVSITDDGDGLDERALRNASGIGHMRTRAALLSARFEMSASGPNGGTRVSVSLPLAPTTSSTEDETGGDLRNPAIHIAS